MRHKCNDLQERLDISEQTNVSFSEILAQVEAQAREAEGAKVSPFLVPVLEEFMISSSQSQSTAAIMPVLLNGLNAQRVTNRLVAKFKDLVEQYGADDSVVASAEEALVHLSRPRAPFLQPGIEDQRSKSVRERFQVAMGPHGQSVQASMGSNSGNISKSGNSRLDASTDRAQQLFAEMEQVVCGDDFTLKGMLKGLQAYYHVQQLPRKEQQHADVVKQFRVRCHSH
jgi:hypothetical protein